MMTVIVIVVTGGIIFKLSATLAVNLENEEKDIIEQRHNEYYQEKRKA